MIFFFPLGKNHHSRDTRVFERYVLLRAIVSFIYIYIYGWRVLFFALNSLHGDPVPSRLDGFRKHAEEFFESVKRENCFEARFPRKIGNYKTMFHLV